MQAMNIVFTPLSVSFRFLSGHSLSSSFLFPLHFSSSLSILQLNTINYDLHLRIIQTLCLHLSNSTPLNKTLTANHYLRIEYFQHWKAKLIRVTICDCITKEANDGDN